MTDLNRSYLDYIARLMANKPHRISTYQPTATDFELRAQHCEQILMATASVLNAMIVDADENVPGQTRKPGSKLSEELNAYFSDLSAGITGTLQRVADSIREVA